MISVKKSLRNSFFILAFALTGQIHTAQAEPSQKTTISNWIDSITRNLANDHTGNAHPLQTPHSLLGNLSLDLDQAANNVFNTSKLKMIDEKRAAFNTSVSLLAQDAAEQANKLNAQLIQEPDTIIPRMHIIIFDSVVKDIPLVSINDKARAMIASGYLNNISSDLSSPAAVEAIKDLVSDPKYDPSKIPGLLSYPNDLGAITRSISNINEEGDIGSYSFEELLTQGKNATKAKIGDIVWQAVYLKVFDFLAANYSLRQREKPWRVNAIADLLIHSLDDNASDNDKFELILGTLQSAKVFDTNNRLYTDEEIMNAIIGTDIDLNKIINSANGPDLVSRLDAASQLNFLRTEDSSKSAADQVEAMLEKLHQIRLDLYKNDLNYAMQQVYQSYISPTLNTLTQIIKGFLADTNEEFFGGETTSEGKLTKITTALKTIGAILPSSEAIDALFLSQYSGKESSNPTLIGNETQAQIDQQKEENMKKIDLNLVQQAGQDVLNALLPALNNGSGYNDTDITGWFKNSSNSTTSLMALRDNFELVTSGGTNGKIIRIELRKK